MDEKNVEQIAEVAKEIIKPVYEDVRPVIKPTAGLLSLPVRAVKASLLNFEKWVISREQNLDDFINRRVPEQLQSIPEDDIRTPNAYIAVPILQAVSYCDSDELNDMYAKLLAKSMYDKTKGQAHPSYVHIIEQICPDEAKILHFLSNSTDCTILCDIHQTHIVTGENRSTISISEIFLENISFLGFDSGCYLPAEIFVYIDNLCRLNITKKKSIKDGMPVTLKEFPSNKADVQLYEHSFDLRINENSINRSFYENCLERFSAVNGDSNNFEENPDFWTNMHRKFNRLCLSEFGEAFINTTINPITIL